MKTLFIHIGTGKTGTTAIQEFCNINRDALASSGLKYCESGKITINHHLLCRNFKKNSPDTQGEITLNMKKLGGEVLASDNVYFLVSSEYFPGLTSDEIDELKNKIDAFIVPIVYLRRQDEFLESWYAQVVKAYKHKANIHNLYKRLANEKILDYGDLVERWCRVNDESKVIVKPYEREQFKNNNIFDDFLSCFPISCESLKMPNKAQNPSIRPNQIKLGQMIHDHCSKDQLNVIYSYIEGLNDTSRFMLSQQDRQEIINRYKDGNNRIAKKYLNQDCLFLNESATIDNSLFGFDFIERFISCLKKNHKERFKLLSHIN